jgi:hypothetical protein
MYQYPTRSLPSPSRAAVLDRILTRWLGAWAAVGAPGGRAGQAEARPDARVPQDARGLHGRGPGALQVQGQQLLPRLSGGAPGCRRLVREALGRRPRRWDVYRDVCVWGERGRRGLASRRRVTRELHCAWCCAGLAFRVQHTHTHTSKHFTSSVDEGRPRSHAIARRGLAFE